MLRKKKLPVQQPRPRLSRSGPRSCSTSVPVIGDRVEGWQGWRLGVPFYGVGLGVAGWVFRVEGLRLRVQVLRPLSLFEAWGQVQVLRPLSFLEAWGQSDAQNHFDNISLARKTLCSFTPSKAFSGGTTLQEPLIPALLCPKP